MLVVDLLLDRLLLLLKLCKAWEILNIATCSTFLSFRQLLHSWLLI